MKIIDRGMIIPQKSEIKINENELALRLGMAHGAELSFAEKCLGEVVAASEPRACYLRCAISVCGDECSLGFARVRSGALAKNLHGCGEMYVFAATLGIAADRLIARKGALSPTELFVADAAASAYMEALADCVNNRLKDGKSCRPRFSPGFGGFGLMYQQPMLDCLNAEKLLGIRLTKGQMMLPTKSVTAVIGIERMNGLENNRTVEK